MLTAVVIALVVAVLRARPRRPDLVRLAVVGALGVPAQAVLGGITVLTGLNPWTVMGHLLLSMVMIGLAVVLHVRAGEGDLPRRTVVRDPLRPLAVGLLALTGAVLAVGTVVTGSGPHSGDVAAGRTGLDPGAMSQLHADLVFLLVGATVGMWVALRATGAPAAAVRAALVLLGVELAQGVDRLRAVLHRAARRPRRAAPGRVRASCSSPPCGSCWRPATGGRSARCRPPPTPATCSPPRQPRDQRHRAGAWRSRYVRDTGSRGERTGASRRSHSSVSDGPAAQARACSPTIATWRSSPSWTSSRCVPHVSSGNTFGRREPGTGS